MKVPHLISVDELRAAGALDVPPEWRKSLGGQKKKERDLFSDLIDDEPSLGNGTEARAETPSDAPDDDSSDELQ